MEKNTKKVAKSMAAKTASQKRFVDTALIRDYFRNQALEFFQNMTLIDYGAGQEPKLACTQEQMVDAIAYAISKIGGEKYGKAMLISLSQEIYEYATSSSTETGSPVRRR